MNARHQDRAMNAGYPLLIALPTGLGDEDAAKLLACLAEAARVLEQHYLVQLQRHARQPDPRQRDLWDDDPPF